MELKNFAIIEGENVTIEIGKIKFAPATKLSKTKTKSKAASIKEKLSEPQIVTLRSDQLFNEGALEFKTRFNSEECGFLFIFNTLNEGTFAVGHSARFKKFIIAYENNPDPIEMAGSLSTHKKGDIVQLKVTVNGSQISLFYNNILICSSRANLKSAPIELRLGSFKDEVELFDIKAFPIKPKVFVVMQFSREYNELYEEVIKPVVEDSGYECIRADEFYTTTPILKDIIENIEGSKAIIAEITPDNPNVFYEIGYSHAINKPTILLCDHRREKLPFDISSFRTLFYENTIAGKKKVENSLTKYLEQIK